MTKTARHLGLWEPRCGQITFGVTSQESRARLSHLQCSGGRSGVWIVERYECRCHEVVSAQIISIAQTSMDATEHRQWILPSSIRVDVGSAALTGVRGTRTARLVGLQFD